MYEHRQRAVILGILFILASVSAIIGALLYNPVLNHPDYLVKAAESAGSLQLGALMELVLVLTAIGTAVTLFPLVRKHNESLAIGYLCFRFLEAIVITVGILSVLALLSLSQSFVKVSTPDLAAYAAAGTTLKAIHAWTFIFGPSLFLGVNTLMYSTLLYQTRLVPRWLSNWGLFGAGMILVHGLLQLFAGQHPFTPVSPLLAVPIGVFEMVLAVRLIVKGFDTAVPTSAIKHLLPLTTAVLIKGEN
ncbi:MAG: DUF4386 domain-containing protein [Candidatus Melainabacteria bacterium HGW-Melainabacteria-1]|nr:MAG: DUF4386 domain-containing protein [Candidatus Melainabacteria bacterium HGW-Melainabacteria-1]